MKPDASNPDLPERDQILAMALTIISIVRDDRSSNIEMCFVTSAAARRAPVPPIEKLAGALAPGVRGNAKFVGLNSHRAGSPSERGR